MEMESGFVAGWPPIILPIPGSSPTLPLFIILHKY